MSKAASQIQDPAGNLDESIAALNPAVIETGGGLTHEAYLDYVYALSGSARRPFEYWPPGGEREAQVSLIVLLCDHKPGFERTRSGVRVV